MNNPEGVYVRQGCSSVPSADTAIRRMIKETEGNRFEAMRCLNQELTFEVTKREFELRNIEFGPQQMRTLKLVDQDNLCRNLGLLLSDQCVHTIGVLFLSVQSITMSEQVKSKNDCEMIAVRNRKRYNEKKRRKT